MTTPRSTILAAFIASICAALQANAAPDASACGDRGNCRRESRHALTQAVYTDGMAAFLTVNDVGADALDGLAQTACDLYAQAHSDFASVASFDGSCAPRLPLRPNAQGGRSAGIDVAGTLTRVRQWDHATLSINTSSWALITAICHDALDDRNVAVGEDGQCYCRFGLDWSAALSRCVPPQRKSAPRHP
jgi:hypothetical protein